MTNATKTTLKLITKPFPDGWAAHEGDWVYIHDKESHNTFYGRIRLKAVTCGKPNCHKCPHSIYAYAQFRDGNKVREKYLGVAR